jgi:hypothetical protein
LHVCSLCIYEYVYASFGRDRGRRGAQSHVMFMSSVYIYRRLLINKALLLVRPCPHPVRLSPIHAICHVMSCPCLAARVPCLCRPVPALCGVSLLPLSRSCPCAVVLCVALRCVALRVHVVPFMWARRRPRTPRPPCPRRRRRRASRPRPRSPSRSSAPSAGPSSRRAGRPATSTAQPQRAP